MINPELNELLNTVESIKNILSESETFNYSRRYFRRGDTIVQEDEENDSIHIILDGLVILTKTYDYETVIQVDNLEPGDLVGLLSFWTGETVFVTAVAKTPVTTLSLTRHDFDRLSTTHPELNRLLQPILINNFAKRYRRIISLHLKVATLTRELENERNQLKEAFEKLELTSNRLIHQEKMATLGQLVAGVAHELNNPTSALSRAVDNLIEVLPDLIAYDEDGKKSDNRLELLNYGINKTVIDTEEQRNIMEELGRKYPSLSRSLLRILSQIDKKGLSVIETKLKGIKSEKDFSKIENFVRVFETGSFLKSIRVSSDRISKLVKSLKSYSRSHEGQVEPVDLRQGIEDTLLILGNRLKNYAFHINLPEIPLVKCQIGEINQVWTNIIINACEAMGQSGILKINCGFDEPDSVWVSISDNGPGIKQEIINKIFEPNFTTKTASGSFGLGLGLSISSEIIQKYGGKIIVSNAPEGGAVFKVAFPVIS
jgi:signal transduction histidine kinase